MYTPRNSNVNRALAPAPLLGIVNGYPLRIQRACGTGVIVRTNLGVIGRRRDARGLRRELGHSDDLPPLASLHTDEKSGHECWGKRLGRPKRVVDAHRVASLRAQGVGWKRIAGELGVGVGTLYRLALDGSKTQERVI
jgi:hypothetical protein